MSKKNTRKAPFKTWDELVKENTVEPLELDVAGTTMVVKNPTGKVINDIRAADEDMEAIITALFGDENARIVLEAWEDAPAMVLNEFVQQIMEYFGLSDSSGNPRPGRS